VKRSLIEVEKGKKREEKKRRIDKVGADESGLVVSDFVFPFSIETIILR